jgi:hypothetical protein
MPRLDIKRDKHGNEFKDDKGNRVPAPSAPGAAASVVTVKVTYDSHIPKSLIETHGNAIWKTAVSGESALHKSTKVRGQGNLQPIGYIHSHGDVCFLVTRINAGQRTIQIDKVGKVNAGVHVFK